MHAALTEPCAVTADGTAFAERVGDAVLLERACKLDEPAMAEAVADVCSPAAHELIEATLARGGNVLVAGPARLARPLVAALAAGAQRPAWLLGPAGAAARPHDVRGVGEVYEAARLGVDFLVVCQRPPAVTAAALLHASGVVAQLEARDVGRALMRLEAAVPVGRDATLAVLGSVDLVVSLAPQAPARVAEVAELVLTDQGYRPVALFVRGPRRRGAGLEPRALPSDWATLADHGYAELAERLAAACPPGGAAAASSPASAALAFDDADGAWDAEDAPVEAASALTGAARAARAAPPVLRAALAASEVAAAAPPTYPAVDVQPGWELDQLEAEAELGAGPAAPSDEPASLEADLAALVHEHGADDTPEAHEAAALAAAFGLAPPPRPSADAPTLHGPTASSGGSAAPGSGPTPVRRG